MKICMIIEKDYPHIGTSREVKTLVQNKNDLKIISRVPKPKGKKDHEYIDGAELYRIKSKINKRHGSTKRLIELSREYIKIIKITKKNNPDVIHCQGINMMINGILLKKILKKPLVFDMRENYPALKWAARKKTHVLKIKVSLLKIFEKIACHYADKIIVVVKESKDRLVKIGVKEKKIFVIMNAENPENLTNKKINKDLQKDLKNRFQNNFIIGYTGFFGYHRGIETAIKAMPIILEKIKNITLLLVGSGRNYKELEDLTTSLRLNEHVYFTGLVPHEDMQTYIQTCDVCIIPHVSNEHTNSTIPNKLFQYMMMQKPQIVTDIKPLERIVEKTKCGLIIPSGDSKALADTVIKLYNNPKLRDNLAKNGYKAAVDEYNWNVEGAKLTKMYEEFKEEK